ncbi:MAG: disulfide bond formation protein B [Proteobacteria bacterium]|nr:disulfide bond formation protein B [Pseudomonadota bacterium]
MLLRILFKKYAAFTAAFLCVALLLFGYYLEFYHQLNPCPLCIFQRLCYAIIFLIYIFYMLGKTSPLAKPLLSIASFIFAGIGCVLAGRQTWLQHLPTDKVPECGPGLEYLLEVYPLFDVLKTVLKGSGDCAETQWVFLNLSIAEWSLFSFSLIAICHLLLLIQEKKVLKYERL